MTEEEAKTKWCPFARITVERIGFIPSTGGGHSGDCHALAGVNRTDTDLPMGRCLASGCMAWRWDKRLSGSSYQKPTEGYCGLAGRPE